MDLSTKNIVCQDSSEEDPNKNPGGSGKTPKNLKNWNDRISCPILTCPNTFKNRATLENHLKRFHNIEDYYIVPKDDFLLIQQKIIDNLPNCVFLLPSESLQEMKPIDLSPELNFNNLPQNRTQDIRLEPSSSDLLNRASIVQPRAPSLDLKISSSNKLENLPGSSKSSETGSLQEIETINVLPEVIYNNLPLDRIDIKLDPSEVYSLNPASVVQQPPSSLVVDIYSSSNSVFMESLNKELRKIVAEFHYKQRGKELIDKLLKRLGEDSCRKKGG